MRTRLLILAAAPIIALLLSISVWVGMYPSENDPKNVRYVLWKLSICTMNIDVAVGTMIGDNNRDDLVIGRTSSELQRRFGFLRGRGEVSSYLRLYSQSPPWRDKEVLFIRASPWMVVFENGRAVKLILVKGN